MKKLFVIPFLGILTFLNGAEISGQGFLKTKGGDVKTCAGNSVYLNIAGNQDDYVLAYSLYKSSIKIQKLMEKINNINNVEDSEEVKIKRNKLNNISKSKYYETQCDAQGNFKFKNIKNGTYNIGTTVEWYVGYEKQGGFIHKEITIKGNQNSVFITE